MAAAVLQYGWFLVIVIAVFALYCLARELAFWRALLPHRHDDLPIMRRYVRRYVRGAAVILALHLAALVAWTALVAHWFAAGPLGPPWERNPSRDLALVYLIFVGTGCVECAAQVGYWRWKLVDDEARAKLRSLQAAVGASSPSPAP